MKQYAIGEKRVIVVKKKKNGQLEITVKEKESDKIAIFTLSRFVTVLKSGFLKNPTFTRLSIDLLSYI